MSRTTGNRWRLWGKAAPGGKSWTNSAIPSISRSGTTRNSSPFSLTCSVSCMARAKAAKARSATANPRSGYSVAAMSPECGSFSTPQPRRCCSRSPILTSISSTTSTSSSWRWNSSPTTSRCCWPRMSCSRLDELTRPFGRPTVEVRSVRTGWSGCRRGAKCWRRPTTRTGTNISSSPASTVLPTSPPIGSICCAHWPCTIPTARPRSATGRSNTTGCRCWPI